MVMIEEWMTIDDAAKYLKLSVAAMRKYIRLNKITSYHQGRIIRLKRKDLDAFMEAGRRGS
jgi:excisionase family DNA binding protein